MPTPKQMDRLGKRIVKARKAKEWNQKDLAAAANLNQGYLSMIERGLKAPSLPTLHKLRTALALDDDVFLAWLDIIAPASERKGAA